MFFEFLYAVLGKLVFFTSAIGGKSSFPNPLSPEDEAKYLRLAREGDKNAKDTLVRHNMRLVAHIVKKYYTQIGGDTDDLISIGTIGLIKGISSFDPEKGARLATYAARCIENEILMYSRSQKKLQGEVSLSDSIETDKEGNALQLMDVVGVDDTMLDDIHDRDSALRLHQIIRERLTTREAEIIRLRYGLGGTIPPTPREIAASFGISRSYVSRRGYCKRRPESLVGQGFRASSVTRIVPRLLYAVRKSRISGHSLVRTINRVVFGILPSRKYQSFQK